MENIQSTLNPSNNTEFYSDLLELSDGKLCTEDGYTFHIHKIELVKNSVYFYRLFCGDIGKGKKDFFIPGISGEILGHILSFIYAGRVKITEHIVCELLIAADYLLLDGLVADINNIYMRDKLSVTNCIPLFLTAKKINRQEIMEKCFRYILTHFETVVTVDNSHLPQLPFAILTRFLNNNNLCVRDENSVWLAIKIWIEADIAHRQWHVPDLLRSFAINDMDETLTENIIQHNVVALFCEEIKKTNKSCSPRGCLEILRNYKQGEETPIHNSLNSRTPSHINFIARYCVHNQTDGVHIFATYDEEIDLWRKIVEIDLCPEFILSVGHDIYMFAISENRNMRYNLIEKEWHSLPHFRVQRNYYAVVDLDGLIYALGGVSVNSEEELNEVEVYSPLENRWQDISPMMPVTSFNAVTLGGKIYIVGNAPHFFNFDMIAQVYIAESDTWLFLESPSIFRFNFALVEYRERLYIIGGRNEDEYLKNVDVFDPNKQEWATFTPLPFTFYLPKATVLNDKLIVYDNHLEDRSYLNTNPVLEWDEENRYWKPFEESSPMNYIHKYCFFTPDDRECIQRISRENKDPKTEFSKSPFS